MDGDTTRQPAWLTAIDAIIVRHCGLTSLPRRAWRLEGRIRQRTQALELNHPSRYLALLTGPSARQEIARLVAAVRVDQTTWMRHKDQLDDLTTIIGSRNGAAHIWSAGCGRGQEAYSIAMLLADAYPTRDFTVLGTDLSEDAIAQAKQGRYPTNEMVGIPARLLAAFWHLSEDAARTTEALRGHISFRVHNLLTDPLPTPQDVIVVRNVLMYFAPSALRTVLNRLATVLVPGGILVTGPSEGHLVRDVFTPLPSANGILWTTSSAEQLPARTEGGDRRHVAWSQDPDPARSPLTSGTLDKQPGSIDPFQPTVRRIKGTFPPERLDALKQELFELVERPSARFIVDLDDVEFLCDEAADLFLRLSAHVEQLGGRLEVTATRPGVRHWIERWNLPEHPTDDDRA